MNQQDIKSHIWITYQGAEGVMVRPVNPYPERLYMGYGDSSETWTEMENWCIDHAFPILNTTEINLEIQGEDLRLKDVYSDNDGNLYLLVEDVPEGVLFGIKQVLIHTPKQTPKADSEKKELPPIEFDSNVLNPDNYDEDGNYHTCTEPLSKVDNHIGGTETHIQELYAENKKLSNLLKLVLDIDALTTTEFCDMYRKEHPAYRGVVDLAVMEMFAVDSHKWHLIKYRAKEIKKELSK